jgi:hypothetical protein
MLYSTPRNTSRNVEQAEKTMRLSPAQLFAYTVLSSGLVALSLSPSSQRAHKSVRQDTRQEETVPPIPLCCYTTRLRAASSPPATCPARSRVLLSPPPPLARVSRRLFSLNPLFQLLFHYHYHHNSPALPLSPSARLLRRCQRTLLLSPPALRCLYSLFHSHASPSGWTPDTTFTTTSTTPTLA